MEADTGWLTAAELTVLQSMGTRRRVPAGSQLFREGDEPAEVFVVVEGMAKVTTTSLDGRELVLELLGPGDLLGELSAVDGAPRSATVTAVADLTVGAIANGEFLAFVKDRPSVDASFRTLLVSRLRQANRRQLEYATVDALGRLCARLDELRERQGGPPERGVLVEVPLTQTELAQWAGLSREAVVKALRKLRVLGWIETTGRGIAVLEPAEIHRRGLL